MNYLVTSLCIALWCTSICAQPVDDVSSTNNAPVARQSKAAARKKRARKKTLILRYHNEPLVDIGNQLAQEQGISILFPSGPEAITQTATLELNYPVTLEQAWTIFYTLLDVSGYSLIKKPDLYTIVKNSKEISREPVPVLIGTPWQDIPDTDERIRYLGYLSNLHVTDTPDNMVASILKELLPDTAKYQTDEASNAVLIVDKASNVRSAMRIISSLDQTNLQEDFSLLKLRYAQASIVAQLFTDLVKTGEQQQPRYTLQRGKQNSGSFFSENVRVIPADRTNSLIILGKQAAIERVRDFILKYIDVELESGSSILHVYQLQYLRAEEFAIILEKIVTSMRSEGGQAKAGAGTAGGTRRSFEGVIIRSDKPIGDDQGKFSGGNKLIIAATRKDWEQIKALIEQLDIPQRQVIIELLIADLTISDTRLLGSMVREPATIPFYDSVQAQSAQAGPVVIDSTKMVNSDLLANVFKDSDGNPVSVLSTFPPGTTAMSFNDTDGRTWGIGVVQKLFSHSKVLQSPHVIATNNKETKIKVGVSRLVNDAASGSTGGTTTATRKRVEANLEVNVIPRISRADTVNLQVQVKIQDFTSSQISDANLVFREVTTNANVASGRVLALGGLTRVDSAQDAKKTPLLNKIPIVGWLFKNRNDVTARLNLTIFISPIIIEPRLRGGVSHYTQDYINLAKRYSQEGMLFDSLRDPITRFFFTPSKEENSVNAIDKFVAKDEFKQSKKLELGRDGQGAISTALATDYALAQGPAMPACPEVAMTEQEAKLASLIDEVDLLENSELQA